MRIHTCLAALVCVLSAGPLCQSGPAAPSPAAASAASRSAPPAASTSAMIMTERQKIDFLIKSVEESGLVFIRNGSEYNSKKAADHLRDKLNYALKRVKPGQQITARDFIKLIASGSSISKKPYLIRQKDGKEVTTAVWLTMRLEELEKTRKPAPAVASKPGTG